MLLVNWTEPVKLSHLLATPFAESGPPGNQKKKARGKIVAKQTVKATGRTTRIEEDKEVREAVAAAVCVCVCV